MAAFPALPQWQTYTASKVTFKENNEAERGKLKIVLYVMDLD